MIEMLTYILIVSTILAVGCMFEKVMLALFPVDNS